MLEALLPAAVMCAEALGARHEVLFAAEEAAMTRAVAKRRREFTTARACARQALAELGIAREPMVPGERGAPPWPSGVVGSMTHCQFGAVHQGLPQLEDYAAAAVALSENVHTLGIDAEPHEALPAEVLPLVSSAVERDRLLSLGRSWPGTHWDRIAFSAKEAVYKAWFPVTGSWLGFEDVDLSLSPYESWQEAGGRETDIAAGSFEARFLVPGPVIAGQRLASFTGRWQVRSGLVTTVLTVPA